MADSIEELTAEVEGQTLVSSFLATVERHRDDLALREQAGEGWATWTFGEYARDVAAAAASLRDLGVGRGDFVVLMMRNRAAFHLLDTAALFLGATPVSIYNSSSPEQVTWLVSHCGAKVAVAEDARFASRFEPARRDLGHLQAVVDLSEASGEVLGGHGTLDLREAAEAAAPASLATVIYTSGTTGPPKGVMITHHNAVYTVASLRRAFGADVELAGKRVVSYLPMAHIAERMVSHYSHLTHGFAVTSCPEASELASYLRDVRPHLLFGVPRVWEKIHAGVTAALAADPDKQRAFEDGIRTAEPIAIDRAWGRSTPEQDATWDFLQDVAFRQVRELTGLDELEFGISGAAPIPADLLSWFRAIGVPLSEIYGMSESSGPMTWEPHRIKPGTVGPAIPGCEVRLADDGEVICRGGNVFTGYLNEPEKTAETLRDGWLHSGDIGELDDDGYLRIIDRKKELIITAGGKNVSPANLEAALKLVPLIGQACAIGDQRPFVSALVVLDPEVAPAWAAQHGIEARSLAELAEHPAVVQEVERGVAEVMEPFNNAERVKRVKILGEEWLPDSAELTPTSKLKRRGIHQRYAAEIDALYA